jgi:hypothetical protein
MASRRIYLSKTKLLSARQCLKRLHLEIHQPGLAGISRGTAAAFETGHQVGALARQLYGGVESETIPYEGGLSHALRKSARLMLAQRRVPIFEATFQHGGVLVRVDTLLPDGDSWRIVEIKASTSVTDEHVVDCAIQRWVFEGLGHRVSSIAVAHVDNTFVYAGDGNYAGLLKEVDQTTATAALQSKVPEWIASAREAAGAIVPKVAVGAQCNKPHDCPFMAHCWPSAAAYPVQGFGGSKAKLGKMIALGYEDIRHVPESELSDKHLRIQRVTRSGRGELLPAARDFVKALPYPRYYLDFETVRCAVPVWPGTRPYETLPFQWSCHFEPEEGRLEHADFLDLSGDAPMRRLAESLIRVLGESGPVLAYTAYEQRIIKALTDRYPDLSAALLRISARLVDLKPVTEQNYYHPAMAGSWSLKAVLPTIADDIDYQKLTEIQDGTAASQGYLEAIAAHTSVVRRTELDARLRRYCQLDTEALVRLVHFLGKPD